jgi:hypothetical protein
MIKSCLTLSIRGLRNKTLVSLHCFHSRFNVRGFYENLIFGEDMYLANKISFKKWI